MSQDSLDLQVDISFLNDVDINMTSTTPPSFKYPCMVTHLGHKETLIGVVKDAKTEKKIGLIFQPIIKDIPKNEEEAEAIRKLKEVTTQIFLFTGPTSDESIRHLDKCTEAIYHDLQKEGG